MNATAANRPTLTTAEINAQEDQREARKGHHAATDRAPIPRAVVSRVVTPADRAAYRQFAELCGLPMPAFNKLVIADLANRCAAFGDHNRAFDIETGSWARTLIPAKDWLISAERVMGAESARLADYMSAIDNGRGE